MRVILCAVPERQAMAEYLAAHIPGLEVSLDRERQGAWRGFARVLAAAGDDGYLHMEDDVTLAQDFMAKVEHEVGLFEGKVVVNFFSQIDFRQSQPRPGREYMSNLCTWFPPGYASLLLTWLPYWQVNGRKGWVNNGRHHSDLAIGDFLAHHSLRFWQCAPSLVQHLPKGSMLGHPGGRMSPTFRDPELRFHPFPMEIQERVDAR